MKKRRAEAVSIIGGADGPTSIFIAGKTGEGKRPFRVCVRQWLDRYRRRRAAKRICANPHTLKDVVLYAAEKYRAAEISKSQRRYTEQYASAREGLILRYRPELLGSLGELVRPDVFDEKAAMEVYRQIQLRSERIAQIPEDELPMDFHVYEIRTGDGWMEMELDFKWGIFGVSYSGSKKAMKKLKGIARDLYLYYGVSEADIKNRTERYAMLLNALSNP